MGNSSRKPQRSDDPQRGVARRRSGRRSSGRRRTPSAARLARLHIAREGDDGSPAAEGPPTGPPPTLLAIHDEQLERLRKDIDLDPEGFLLDNLLLSVQFFKNYDQEMTALWRAAALRDAALLGTRRLLLPDSLHAAVARHVRWRPRHNRPDTLLGPQRFWVLSDNVNLLYSTPSGVSRPAARSSAGSGPTYNLAVEAVTKPGIVKLRRVTNAEAERPQRSEFASTPDLTAAQEATPLRHSHWGSNPDIANGPSRRPTEFGSIPDVYEVPRPSAYHYQSTPDVSVDPDSSIQSEPLGGMNRWDSTPEVAGNTDPGQTSLRRIDFGSTPDMSVTDRVPHSQPPWVLTPLAMVLNELQELHQHQNERLHPKQRPNLLSLPQHPSSQPSPQPSSPTSPPHSSQDSGSDTLCDSCRGTMSHRSTPATSQKNLRPESSRKRSAIRGPGSVVSDKSSLASFSASDLSGGSSLSWRSSPVPLDEFRLGAVIDDTNVIPEECFQSQMVISTVQEQIIMRVRGVVVDEDDDAAEPQIRMHLYLSPAVFMASFADLFAEVLAAAMGFPRESVVGATVRHGAILCDRNGPGTTDQCQVTPGLRLPFWPSAAAEWVFRTRASWPPSDALRRIYELGAVVTPSAASTSPVRTNELQWTLAFPDAEQLLELSLSSTQAHCYLSLLALHRCFLEPAGRYAGLSTAHMRAFFLWQCERDTGRVPDPNRPGRALRAQLSALYSTLQNSHLPDYFVCERNLLAETPVNLLRRVQERVFRVRERLFLNTLQACRRLAFVEGEAFYPQLDYDRLAAILASERSSDQADLVASQYHSKQPDWKTNYLRQVESERTAFAANKLNKASELTLRLGLRTEESKQRTSNVLIFFCKHFSKMGRCSAKFGATEQARQYLQQCYHLLTILQEDYGCAKSATDILQDVKKAELALLKAIMAKSSSALGQQTPVPPDLTNHQLKRRVGSRATSVPPVLKLKQRAQ